MLKAQSTKCISDVAGQVAGITHPQTGTLDGSSGGGITAISSPEVHDGLTMTRLEVAVLNAEMKATHTRNFSVSSEVDPGESRY